MGLDIVVIASPLLEPTTAIRTRQIRKPQIHGWQLPVCGSPAAHQSAAERARIERFYKLPKPLGKSSFQCAPGSVERPSDARLRRWLFSPTCPVPRHMADCRTPRGRPTATNSHLAADGRTMSRQSGYPALYRGRVRCRRAKCELVPKHKQASTSPDARDDQGGDAWHYRNDERRLWASRHSVFQRLWVSTG